MKLIKVLRQHRRDLVIECECEGCGERIQTSGYDDANFWSNVVPNFKCPKCGESTKSLGLNAKEIKTRYPQHMVV